MRVQVLLVLVRHTTQNAEGILIRIHTRMLTQTKTQDKDTDTDLVVFHEESPSLLV